MSLQPASHSHKAHTFGSGKRAANWQRFSAWGLLLYVIYLAITLWTLPSDIYQAGLLQSLSPFFLIATFVAWGLVFIHAWVGLRDILIDYTPRARTGQWLTLLKIVLLVWALNLITLTLYQLW